MQETRSQFQAAGFSVNPMGPMEFEVLVLIKQRSVRVRTAIVAAVLVAFGLIGAPELRAASVNSYMYARSSALRRKPIQVT